jgi:hypothetical protein
MMLLMLALLSAACVESNGRFGGTVPDGTRPATGQTVSAGEDCAPGGT